MPWRHLFLWRNNSPFWTNIFISGVNYNIYLTSDFPRDRYHQHYWPLYYLPLILVLLGFALKLSLFYNNWCYCRGCCYSQVQQLLVNTFIHGLRKVYFTAHHRICLTAGLVWPGCLPDWQTDWLLLPICAIIESQYDLWWSVSIYTSGLRTIFCLPSSQLWPTRKSWLAEKKTKTLKIKNKKWAGETFLQLSMLVWLVGWCGGHNSYKACQELLCCKCYYMFEQWVCLSPGVLLV